MTLNFIHLKKEQFDPKSQKEEYDEAFFREINIKKQVQEQGITDFKIWDGIINTQLPFVGIGDAHRQIVRDAKERGTKSVIIAEDDIYFSHPNSWKYFLENEPADYSAFFGCIYKSSMDENNRVLFGLSGLTLYRLHESYYDIFLNLKIMNHIDREMGRFAWKYKYIVCKPFVCSQHGGYSFNKKENIESYEPLLEGIELYKG